MKIYRVLVMLCFSVLLQAALAPWYYESSKENASEVLSIEITDDLTSFISMFLNQKEVKLEAKVVGVLHTQTNLKINDIITIEYTTMATIPEGWVGPTPAPILEEGKTYTAYLEKSRHGNYYSLAAGGESFEMGYLGIIDE